MQISFRSFSQRDNRIRLAGPSARQTPSLS
jgi:hypothetical protein